jgi:hypothetical protein
MTIKNRNATLVLGIAGLVALATGSIASAEVAGDQTFISCSDSGGSFRISELNRSVYRFSERYQEYRPICRDCEVVEWGQRIVLKDGSQTVVQMDRQSGRILVRGMPAKNVAGSFAVQSFQGVCKKGRAVVPHRPDAEMARAF